MKLKLARTSKKTVKSESSKARIIFKKPEQLPAKEIRKIPPRVPSKSKKPGKFKPKSLRCRSKTVPKSMPKPGAISKTDAFKAFAQINENEPKPKCKRPPPKIPKKA